MVHNLSELFSKLTYRYKDKKEAASNSNLRKSIVVYSVGLGFCPLAEIILRAHATSPIQKRHFTTWGMSVRETRTSFSCLLHFFRDSSHGSSKGINGSRAQNSLLLSSLTTRNWNIYGLPVESTSVHHHSFSLNLIIPTFGDNHVGSLTWPAAVDDIRPDGLFKGEAPIKVSPLYGTCFWFLFLTLRLTLNLALFLNSASVLLLGFLAGTCFLTPGSDPLTTSPSHPLVCCILASLLTPFLTML